MKKMLLTLLLLIAGLGLSAQRVDTVAVHSKSMDIKIKNVVVLPAGYAESPSQRYPVLYLLHGYSGRYDSWVRLKPELAKMCSDYNVIVVCPDGKNSWYWDSPVDPKLKYDTYVSKELVRYIDANYRTIAAPEGRAVTGLSMGGHGGLWLGFTHQNIFGACGAMSGGVDIRPFPENWEMKRALGEYADNPRRWEEYTVINQVYRLKANGKPAIIIDCGTADFFFQVNEELHKKLMYNNIPHEYISRPGAHNGPYWQNAIEGQMLFFKNFFYKNK